MKASELAPQRNEGTQRQHGKASGALGSSVGSLFLALGLPLSQNFVAAAPIQFAGQKSQLVVSEISGRTVRIELSTLDEQGHARAATPSTILGRFPATEKLRVRELAGEKEIGVGQLRITIKPQPLPRSAPRGDGRLRQEPTSADGT